MARSQLLLLILLNIAHWLADYTHLSRPYMLQAKRLGTPLKPILDHALAHGLLQLAVLIFFDWRMAGWLAVFQVATHFSIDVWKGRMNGWFPSLQNPANPYHWYIFGFDQLLHQIVILIIAFSI